MDLYACVFTYYNSLINCVLDDTSRHANALVDNVNNMSTIDIFWSQT